MMGQMTLHTWQLLKQSGWLETAQGRIANLMMDMLPHHINELSAISKQYNARIYELRRGEFHNLRFDIRPMRTKTGHFYILEGVPESIMLMEGEKGIVTAH